MSKFKGKLARRIMAFVLSGAMVMSNMSVTGAGTAYAAELATNTATEISAEVSEDRESEAKETVAAELEETVQAESSASENTSESSEKKTEETTESASTEKDTEAEPDSTETETSSVEETTTDIETSSAEVDTTIEDTTEEETTEVETTEEEVAKEEKNKAEANVYVFEASKISGAENVKEADADGTKHEVSKTKATSEEYDDYFTIIYKYSGNSKLDYSKKTWEDGYSSTVRINFGGGLSVPSDDNANKGSGAIKFTTSNSATVKIWWVPGGTDRPMIIKDETNEIKATTGADVTYDTSKNYLSELKLDSKGTYYLGSGNSNNYIFKVEVIEDGSSSDTTARKDWSTVAAPVIGTPVLNAEDANKVDVPVTMVIGDDGADSVEVSAYLESDTEAKAKATAKTKADEENKAVATLTLKDTGKYYFKAEAKRTKYEETDTNKESKFSADSELFDFALPFETAPVINSITSLGQQDDGTVKVAMDWTEVKEATGYTITYWERKDDETRTETENREHPDAAAVELGKDALNTDLSLEAGKYYFITVTATRTLGEGDTATTDKAESKIGYIYTLAKALDIYTIESKLFETFPAGDKADGAVEPGGTDNYFELAWNAKSKLDTSTKTWPDGYTSGQRFNFGGTINASEKQNYIKFTAKEQSVVKVWWACGGAGRGITIEKLGEDGKTSEVVTPAVGTVSNTPYLSTFTLEEGGTYYVGNTVGNNYIFRVTVEEGEHAGEIRERWDTVAAPVIKEAKQSNPVNKDTNAPVGQLDVSVTIDMGTDGADAVYVDMYDSKDKLIGREESMTSGVSEVSLSFKPKATGQYYFRAGAYRIGEEDSEKISEKSAPYDFIYMLTTPAISSVTNLGDGKVEVEWGSVDEATAYVLKIYDETGETLIQTIEAGDKTVWEITEGLEIGKTYNFAITALRPETPGTDANPYHTSVESGKFKKEITTERQTKWSFSAYGSSTSITSKVTKAVDSESGEKGDSVPANGSYADFDGKSEGFVEVWSLSGKGKIVPNTTDGLAFYYTEIDPKETNFTLTATAHVNEWKISNGQDGFGLMASDAVGKNGNGDALWTNSYQAVVSKIEYRWDAAAGTVADYNDVTKTRYSMKLGVGATEKKGATADDVKSITAGEITQPGNWATSTVTLDTSVSKLAAGTYNIVGNYTDAMPEGTVSGDLLLTDFKLTLQKNNTGYFLTYENVNTGESLTQKYYDTEALNHIVEDKVYVGFFASRNADVTFKDISFTTIKPEDDDPAEEQPITYVPLSRSVLSGATANTSDYNLVFTSNWSGTLTARDSKGRVLGSKKVTGSLDPELSKLKDNNDKKSTKETITLSGLSIGQNVFTLTYTPDITWQPDDYTMLKSYDPVTFTHTVDFKKYGADGSNIYAAPKGKASGTGTKADPLDIYTAVKYVQPGQKIVLLGGRYSLYKTLTIERGIDGTQENRIYMVADTDAIGANRPVFDFNQECPGMTIAANYWYFKGFDVTKSADANDGIKVSGSYNTLDQINSYKNGNTGIQISRYKGTDTWSDWPSHNKILNCTSYLNSDKGYEDADGFAAKLTIGTGNEFDGCIAAYNADDGWDLFAKIESGNIGAVTIKNSVAYMNGYVLKDSDGNLSLEGTLVNAGNGNGFKMGGDALFGGNEYEDPPYSGHKLQNSVAFFNKSKGFDSNSCPNNKIYNSVSFDNEGPNISLYTYTNVQNTEYVTENIISYRTKYKGVTDDISGKVNGETILQTNATTYQWDNITKKSINSENKAVDASWFVENAFTFSVYDSPEMYTEPQNGMLVGRNADGTVNMNGFLTLSPSAGQESIGGTSSDDSKIDTGKDTDGSISAGSNGAGDDTIEDEDTKALADALANTQQNSGVIILQVGNELDETADKVSTGKTGEETYALNRKISVPYTGAAVKPQIAVYINGEQQTNYSVSYKNNIMAYVAGDKAYAAVPEAKRPLIMIRMNGSYQEEVTAYFDITPVDLNDEELVAAPAIAVAKPQAPKPALIFNGRTLSNGKDYTITKTITKETNPETGETTEKESAYSGGEISGDCRLLAEAAAGSNFTGSVQIPYRVVDADKLLSKAKLTLDSSSFLYTGNKIKAAVKLDGTDVTTLTTTIGGEKYPLYKVAYANAVQVGKATATVTATEYNTDYAGSKTLSFTIKKAPIKKTDVYIGDSVITVLGNKTYTGSAQTHGIPYVKITDPNNETTTMQGVRKGSVYTNQLDENGLYVYNYTYEYKNNTDAGTAQLVVKGIHNCSGSASFSFKIEPPASVEEKDLKVEFDHKDAVYTYTPSGVKPSVAVYYKGNGVSAKNYSVSYKNNRNVGPATMTITLKGGLKAFGKKDYPYTIEACDISAGSLSVKSISDVFTNGKETIKKSDLEKSRAVIMADNARLSNNRDYTLVYEWQEGTDTKTYDAADKSGKADLITIPKTGLPVKVYAKTAKNGNYIITDGKDDAGNVIKRDKILVAEFRAAWFDIAKATVKLSTDGRDKVILYYKDATETGVKDNRLSSDNLYVYHSAYASYSRSTDKLGYVDYRYKGKSTDVNGYTYYKEGTDAASAGNQKVILYGTGIFGGSKVFTYRLEKKTYNISRAVVDKDITITIPASPDAYWQKVAEKDAIVEAEKAVEDNAKKRAVAEAKKAVNNAKEAIRTAAREAASAKNPDTNSAEYKLVYNATYNAEYLKVYNEAYNEEYKRAYDDEKENYKTKYHDEAYAAAYRDMMMAAVDAAEEAAKASWSDTADAYEAYADSVKNTADTAAKEAGEAAKNAAETVKKAEEAAGKVSEDSASDAYKDAYNAVLENEYQNAYTKKYAEAYSEERGKDEVYGGKAFTAKLNSNMKDAAIRDGLEGKITVNGKALNPIYLDFDNTAFTSGKCTVEITGTNSYFGMKKITVTVN